jgi:hypothetical protein
MEYAKSISLITEKVHRKFRNVVLGVFLSFLFISMNSAVQIVSNVMHFRSKKKRGVGG